MAEILGLVASGVTVAQVAGEILGASLKIKGLLNECNEMPARLELLLNQVEILAPIISEASANYDALPYRASLNGVLRNAVLHCQMASDQLTSLAGALSIQIDTSRGVKRKLKLVKALLRRDLVEQCESSLQNAVQLLSLAQQTYILALQRLQPEIIASQFLHHLESHNGSTSQGCEIVLQGMPHATRNRRVESNGKANQSGNILDHGFRFGFPSITGAVEIYCHSRESASRNIGVTDKESERTALLRLKLQMPIWLCSWIIDSTMYRSYSGWTQTLRTYRTHPKEPGLLTAARAFIQTDDVIGIRRLFQATELGHLDRFAPLQAGDPDFSLLDYSIELGAWNLSSYLLQHGAEITHLYSLAYWDSKYAQPDNEIRQFMAFITDDRVDDATRSRLLYRYKRSSEDFSRLRRQIWPDDEFYSNEFRHNRHQLVVGITNPASTFSKIFQPEVFLRLLSKSGHLQPGDVDFDWPGQGVDGILHAIAQMIGRAVWLNSPHARDAETIASEARLNACAKALKVWLALLQRGGFDLAEYGAREKHQLACEQRSSPQRYYIYGELDYDPMQEYVEDSGMVIRLIALTYGSEIDDWKFWWSEPTDTFVGQFWEAIEPKLLRIPGSWVDDDA
ncbi:hypothetical protein NUW58_g2790 [Xylaria curta]|uniref:Uncharacterized protein n=1 Tax=Xylaria curta TaxID=42375 RepID=A0ACC1PEE9_9PEZI|nr:hypothetical protein NUW58_g2790 [Xylaria curta]